MPEKRVLFFGDSITFGVGDSNHLGWPHWLRAHEQQRDLSFTGYNLGIRSDTSRLIRDRWQAEALARLPKRAAAVLVFSFGLNDATRVNGRFRVTLEDSIAHCRAIFGAASAMGTLLWVGPTPIDDTTQPLLSSLDVLQFKSNAATSTYNDAYRVLASEMSVPYLDLFDRLRSNESWTSNLSDGVHPNREGHHLMAEEVAKWSAWRRICSNPQSTAVL